ncbi:MAG: hypothetical protein EOO22_07585, partial [Comamonadaceae bacterium]
MPRSLQAKARFRPSAHRFALESRQLFDGAALVEVAAAGGDGGADAHHAAPEHAVMSAPPAPPPQRPAADAAHSSR